MKPRSVGTAIGACALLVLVGPRETAAQFRELQPAEMPRVIPEVCESEPPHGQPTCANRQAAFAAWMAQMAEGVVMYTLPTPLRDLLQGHYPGVDLGTWRFGFASKQDIDNATTDCSGTYVNEPTFVERLRLGQNLGSVNWYDWLAHELRHYEQCMAMGIETYRKMWWDDLDDAMFQTLITDGMVGEIHDRMAMEADAIARAEDVAPAILNCCIHPVTGEVIDSIQVGDIEIEPRRPQVGDTVRISVDVAGGAEPRFYAWERSDPDGFSRGLGTSAEAEMPVDEAGEWAVTLQITQGMEECNSEEPLAIRLPCWNDEWTIDVVEPTVTQLRLDETRLDFGESTTAYFTVEHLRDGTSVTVNFSASHSTVSVTVPADAVVPGTGALQETGSFQVDIGNMVLPLLQDARIPVRAWIGSDPSDGVSASVTIPGIDIESVGVEAVADPMRREVYRVAVKLSRAVRVPVTIQLDSSDPRVLEVPSSITVEPGQTSATLDLLPSEGLRDARDVTVRAFHAQPDFTPREATFTVRGSRR